jgi:hypothetical protein
LLGEPCSAVVSDCVCSMVNMATKMFTVGLGRESRHVNSSQNFLSKIKNLRTDICDLFDL